VIGKPTANLAIHRVGLLAVIAAELVQTLSQPELSPCIVWRQRRGLAEEGQGFCTFSGAGKNGREVALGVGVFRILLDGFAQGSFCIFVSAEPGVGDTQADIGIRVSVIQVYTAFEWPEGFMPGLTVWGDLRDWWLKHKRGANTPNWDIALGCTIEGRPGLILVEAKANWPELGTGGKLLDPKASEKSRDNHNQIGVAIDQACAGWKRIDPRVSIARDSHYQLANRLAFTWKLATLGIPVVLMYLGFLGDEGIRADAGAPFADDQDWQRAFSEYASGVVPLDLFGRRLDFGAAPVWLLSRSRPVLEQSPLLPRR
jgi:hypothetical protein